MAFVEAPPERRKVSATIAGISMSLRNLPYLAVIGLLILAVYYGVKWLGG
ncbi:hypothetical protein [Mesorhizobium sp. M7A.F.Ca.MR.362.00.0.0]|nr:hypothetical protein [Mesorhizobium sp. M7A.F.Ca.MR.362.00.0.0]